MTPSWFLQIKFKKIILIILGSIIVLGCAVLINRIIVKLVPEGTQHETKTEPKPDAPTIPQALAMVVRAHHALKVCYDSSLDGFLLYYREPTTPAEEIELKDRFTGWYFIETPQMWKLSNGSWMMKDLSADKYVQVYPDVSDLTCKDKK